jgi:membrane-bound ClpP family serine protease
VTRLITEGSRQMGANRQQGWSLLLFLVGFTFLVAGLFALGAIFSIVGLGCLIASAIWCYRIKPLEHQGTEAMTAEPVSMPQKKRQAV